MNKLIHLITAFLLLTVSGEAFAQDIIVEIRVGGEVMSPVTLSTSEGTIVVDGSATYNKNVQIYSGKDAQGRDIVVPSGNVSYKTGEPTVREYYIKTLYGMSESDADTAYDNNAGSYEYSGGDTWSSVGYNAGKAVGTLANSMGDAAMRHINVPTDGYPNIQLAIGASYAYGEFARLKLCLGGEGGFVLYGGVGKDWIFNGDNSDATAWHADLGYYLTPDENQDFTLGVCYAETPVVDGGALMLDLSYSYFFGKRMIFGVFGGGGIGVGNISEITVNDEGHTKGGKFVWDLQLGIAMKLWQK